MPAVTATVRALLGLRAGGTSDFSSTEYAGIATHGRRGDGGIGSKSRRGAGPLQGGSRHPNRDRAESAVSRNRRASVAPPGPARRKAARYDQGIGHPAFSRAAGGRPLHGAEAHGI